MGDFTFMHLEDVEDQAAKFGHSGMESRFAREPLGLENSGFSHFRLEPNYRVPWGHRHKLQEEIYVVIGGSARFKLGDEIVRLDRLDAVRVPPQTARGMEGGPEGAEILAFAAPGVPVLSEDVEMLPDWWTDEEGS